MTPKPLSSLGAIVGYAKPILLLPTVKGPLYSANKHWACLRLVSSYSG